VTAPDSTIDFIFYSSHLELVEKRVRREDTEGISDHYLLVARFRLQSPYAI
jgi:endonuclease/exonuclease/phosphatase family metal-dependent hydrolase